jgi:hypothetical protein
MFFDTALYQLRAELPNVAARSIDGDATAFISKEMMSVAILSEEVRFGVFILATRLMSQVRQPSTAWDMTIS